MTSDSEKQTIEAGIKDREEAITRTVEKAVQDLDALTRKADVVSGCALDADKLSAGLSEFMQTVDLIYDELFDKNKRAQDSQA